MRRFFGDPGGIRTPDTWFRRRGVHRSSYLNACIIAYGVGLFVHNVPVAEASTQGWVLKQYGSQPQNMYNQMVAEASTQSWVMKHLFNQDEGRRTELLQCLYTLAFREFHHLGSLQVVNQQLPPHAATLYRRYRSRRYVRRQNGVVDRGT
jgi:hypothetical protein